LAWVIRTPIKKIDEAEALLEHVIWHVTQQESLALADRVQPSAGMALKLLSHRLGDPERIYQDIGPGFLATESVIYAIGIFLSNPTDFQGAVLTAVNDGGDSDSTASMIGGMVGANCGLESIPAGWRSFQSEYASSLELGQYLYMTAVA
jgi:ADP-ribosylglycohydrolase